MEWFTIKLIIPMDKIPSLNKFVNAQRVNRYAGAKQKKDATQICELFIRKAMKNGFEVKNKPAKLKFTWYCRNRREDPDNIQFKKKFILDGAVNAGLLENDGWRQIAGFEDVFKVDKDNVRVEIEEVEP